MNGKIYIHHGFNKIEIYQTVFRSDYSGSTAIISVSKEDYNKFVLDIIAKARELWPDKFEPVLPDPKFKNQDGGIMMSRDQAERFGFKLVEREDGLTDVITLSKYPIENIGSIEVKYETPTEKYTETFAPNRVIDASQGLVEFIKSDKQHRERQIPLNSKGKK